jgi:1-deoxy-D-xylulose-5-phosphate reductoisomerase
VLNAANEVAVAAFLDEKIRFDQIHAVNLEALARYLPPKPANLEDLLAIDQQARALAQAYADSLQP